MLTELLWSCWSPFFRLRHTLNGRVEGSLVSRAEGFLDDDNDAVTVDQALGLFGRLQIDHKSKPFRERLRLYGRLDREDLRADNPGCRRGLGRMEGEAL